MNRIFDLCVSIIGISILAPLLITISITILIINGNPIIFKQDRIGRNGIKFKLYKFRSMKINNSCNTVSVSGDKRITKLGGVLRKYKLDELPSLFNVLIGDMSIVGPRPDVPGYADKLVGNDRKILQLKPGITGPASIKYRNEEEILSNVKDPIYYNDNVIYPDKININLKYYEEKSILLDIKYIIKTILTL